jgi:uncharacterized membrane protein
MCWLPELQLLYEKIVLTRDLANVDNGAGGFSLPTSIRNTVSPVLIIHPVAAFLTLICFALAVAAHFHAPAHSVRYLLGLFILLVPTVLLSLLAFLVDVLIFIPNVGFAGWLVLASTLILLVCAVVTCCMRRSLVGRKARRKRIAENAEMNGENYFANRQSEQMEQMATLPKADSPPPLSGDTITSSEKGTGFAAFDLKPTQSADDRVPLNPSNASVRSGSRGGYDDPGRGGPPGRGPPVDQYGNPLPPGPMGAPLRQQNSNTSLGSTPSNRSGGPPGPYYGRGRGGYPPMPGRGGYPPRGGMMRGGPQGMRGPPPPGYGRGRGGMPPGAMMGRGGYPPPRGGYGGYGMPSRGPPMMDNQGPIGQAVELDERTGLPSPSQSRPNSGPREGDMPGMVGMMQQPRRSTERGPMSPSSDYEHSQSPEYEHRGISYKKPRLINFSRPYVPPRAQWGPQRNVTPMNNRTLSPIQASPTSQLQNSPPRVGGRGPSAADNYVEDIDPAFADPAMAATIPTALMPGPPPPNPTAGPPLRNEYLQPNDSSSFPSDDPSLERYGGSSESLPEGQRSPAASDASHFTSVSQRGVNPDWRPAPSGPPQPRREDMLLNSNPDFMIPGAAPRGRGGFRGRGGPPRGGPRPMMGMGGGPMVDMRGPMPGMGGRDGRYPSAF